jgi:hypothetical protein
MNRHLITWLPCALLMLCTGIVRADSLYTSASVLGGYEQCSDLGSGSAACQTSGSTALGAGSATFRGMAEAEATYGILGVSVNATADCSGITSPYNCYGVNSGNTSAIAEFTDTFTISAGPTSGFLVIDAFTEGNSSDTCVGPSAAIICGNSPLGAFIEVSGGSIDGVTGNTDLSNGLQYWTLTIPYSLGSVTPTFEAGAEEDCRADNDTSCTGFVDYYHTFGITGISVENSNAVLDPGAVVTAESGTDYDNLISTPEPRSVALFLVGLGALGLSIKKALKVFKVVRRTFSSNDSFVVEN